MDLKEYGTIHVWLDDLGDMWYCCSGRLAHLFANAAISKPGFVYEADESAFTGYTSEGVEQAAEREAQEEVHKFVAPAPAPVEQESPPAEALQEAPAPKKRGRPRKEEKTATVEAPAPTPALEPAAPVTPPPPPAEMPTGATKEDVLACIQRITARLPAVKADDEGTVLICGLFDGAAPDRKVRKVSDLTPEERNKFVALATEVKS